MKMKTKKIIALVIVIMFRRRLVLLLPWAVGLGGSAE